MLYLEDYLELIEHLPQELRDRFTYIREQDLQVQNKSERLNERNQAFFAEAKKLKPEQRQCEFETLLKEYDEIIGFADGKIKVAIDMQNLLLKLTQRLDNELEKFKLELEADHAGITEELEKRSLELDLESRALDEHNSSSLNHLSHECSSSKQPSTIKDRRRSEQKQIHHKQHRHHPYQNNQDNGYNGRAKLSYDNDEHRSSVDSHHNHGGGSKTIQNGDLYRQQQPVSAFSPTQSEAGYSYMSGPGSVASDSYGTESGHYENNLSSFGNNPGFKTNTSTNKKKIQNIDSNLQHPTLGAALSSTSPKMNSTSPIPLSYSWYPWCGSLGNQTPQGNTPIYHRDETKYCTCRQVSYGEMVACDNNECEIEWFHYDCVGITQPPKGKWYCPDCSKKMKIQRKYKY